MQLLDSILFNKKAHNFYLSTILENGQPQDLSHTTTMDCRRSIRIPILE